jgi:phospholipid/cholesterol/gamma-HCH transport system substrate-binding protein
MKKSSSQQIKLGLFVVVGAILLIAALYFIGSRQHLFTKNIQLYAEFENVNGLQLGNNVRYSGINVGTVSKIEMTDSAKIIVQMMIEEETGKYIRKDAIATIASDGLVGSMVVNILPGKLSLPIVISGDTITSYSRIGADDMLSTLSVTNENVALLTANLLKITDHILEGQGALGLLITDSTLTKDLRQTITNLRETTESTASSLKKINQLIAQVDLKNSPAGVLLSDTLSGNQVATIIDNLENSSNDIGKVTTGLEDLITQIKDGDGAFNYLTQNKTLVKDIDTTLTNIKESSYKLNQNMEALKHNFLFRGYFKRLERKERRAEKRQETIDP